MDEATKTATRTAIERKTAQEKDEIDREASSDKSALG